MAIGVGIIGANPQQSWARDAHIPALAASPAFKLRAVATSRSESAAAAAELYGVAGYTDALALASDPAVDLVVVAVKVPHHAELIRAVLPAGKPILCEWPLGTNLGESRSLAREAEAAGVRTFVGLQGRASPAIRHVKALLDAGYVGTVLWTSVIGTAPLPGPVLDEAYAYSLDARNGASLSSISFGHAIDAVCWCLGELQDITARTARLRDSVTLRESGRVVPMTVPDQLGLMARLANGAFVSAHYRAGPSAATGFLWEIGGSEGTIAVNGPHGVIEMAELGVSGSRGTEPLRPLVTPAECLWAPAGTPEGLPFNVAQLYALIADDLADGGRRVPSFADAADRHAMLAEIDPLLR